MRNIILVCALLASASVCAAPYKIKIPYDPKATYTVLDIGREGEYKTIITKREGPSGKAYSKRIYNCMTNEVKYLGSGETLEQMKNSKPDPKMGGIVSGSIADYVGREACK